MADYQTMYLHLFNRVTDAIAAIDALNFGDAKDILCNAQQEAEDIYLREEESNAQE